MSIKGWFEKLIGNGEKNQISKELTMDEKIDLEKNRLHNMIEDPAIRPAIIQAIQKRDDEIKASEASRSLAEKDADIAKNKAAKTEEDRHKNESQRIVDDHKKAKREAKDIFIIECNEAEKRLPLNVLSLVMKAAEQEVKVTNIDKNKNKISVSQ